MNFFTFFKIKKNKYFLNLNKHLFSLLKKKFRLKTFIKNHQTRDRKWDDMKPKKQHALSLREIILKWINLKNIYKNNFIQRLSNLGKVGSFFA